MLITIKIQTKKGKADQTMKGILLSYFIQCFEMQNYFHSEVYCWSNPLLVSDASCILRLDFASIFEFTILMPVILFELHLVPLRQKSVYWIVSDMCLQLLLLLTDVGLRWQSRSSTVLFWKGGGKMGMKRNSRNWGPRKTRVRARLEDRFIPASRVLHVRVPDHFSFAEMKHCLQRIWEG